MITTTSPADDAMLLLQVTGMTCQGCAGTVQRVLLRVTGVREVAVDLATGQVKVRGAVSPEQAVAVVRDAGYGAQVA